MENHKCNVCGKGYERWFDSTVCCLNQGPKPERMNCKDGRSYYGRYLPEGWDKNAARNNSFSQ